MQRIDGKYALYGSPITRRQSRAVDRWQRMFIRKFSYDPEEHYRMRVREHPQADGLWGLRELVRTDTGGAGGTGEATGEEVDPTRHLICSTVRMGFGHYRIAMAGASCAAAMGFEPVWLDLLGVPGITSQVIDFCNSGYSRFSRMSQKSELFNRFVWEKVTTGERTLPLLDWFLNHWIVGWPWRFVKTNIKDYKMSELFRNLHEGLPPQTPTITAHMWNCMGAVAGGMTNVVDMVFDNWPMAFQLTEGAMHGIQSPAAYYGFRTKRGFDDRGRNLSPVPADAVYYVGHHVDHELVENIDVDCERRLERMSAGEPRRFLITMGGAGAQRELFRAVIDHCLPRIRRGELALFVNLGDHRENWEWLKGTLGSARELVTTHFSFDTMKELVDEIRSGQASGLHVMLFDTTFHAVYATNYLMRVVDVMITKPSELAFYPVPKIFNRRVGGHEKWGAIRSAELGDGTVETRTVSETLTAIDLLCDEDDLLRLYCDRILANKYAGIYDGAYRCVELATGVRAPARN
ncbi:MAG: DUF6938 domain-containing protein [Spirochaetaceae bacterium]